MNKESASRSGNRITGYDIARGTAVLIMLMINFNGTLSLGGAGPEWLLELMDFLNRRAAVILVMVSGIGLSLFLGPSALEKGDLRTTRRRTLMDRAAFLFICGYLLTLIWSGDILHFYAVFIFTGIFLSSRSRRFLILTAMIIWLAGFIQFFEIFDLLRTENQAGFFAAQVTDIFFSGYYPFFPWAAIFILGMLLGRQDFSDKRKRQKMAAAGAVLFVSSELASRGLENLSLAVSGAAGQYPGWAGKIIFLLGDLSSMDLSQPTPFSVISGVGFAVLVIMAGLSLPLRPRTGITSALVISGRSSLTLYIGHILFLVALVQVFKGTQNLIPLISGSVLFFIIYVRIMSAWLKTHGNGPLETLMRSFSPGRIISKPRRPAVNQA
ncbi:heparan-alpha-glucosaminide N-acetyltransferase domain-containing protein [Desulfospira joergensenii]|uniref:heparan-alpha-glucosaminide N-acetyltransferase domain-containing protein n=1 Tax=Desulfospira joergensenii TaxID=53329 RepID=UPI0003B311F0|nr:heparan-alpha-glucosaminide N-acetyltransferase domain-containing protein [Desulfospira joergensenii]